ncbi:MAG: ATP-binding protein [Spirochaetes bacterium]|nr:ATP-binding protein [Spirochaetota bacterium]
MKELVVISGKGGTGKTSIAAAFSFLAVNKVMADCDVDAADLHLVLNDTIIESGEFIGGKKALIDAESCNRCGLCVSYCRFNAIHDLYKVDDLSCEGCGVCAFFCPSKSIEMNDHISGRWYISKTPYGPLVRAKLGIAEGNSGKLVTILRQKAREIAYKKSHNLIIVDGSPGTGCPVIATITGATHVLIVTEPTVAGIHDLNRILELTRHFRVQTSVCVNKADINCEKKHEINELCRTNDVQMLMEIPYDIDVIHAQIAGKSVVEYSNGPAAAAITKLWEEVSDAVF